jgi:predicted kinase
MHLIVMAGLPGTGKSTLARALASAIGARVLDKDLVRAELFGSDRIEYSRTQDDHCVQRIFETIDRLRPLNEERFVIFDGRTHSRREQIRALEEFVASRSLPWCLIECTCSESIAIARIERDRAAKAHVALNRTTDLYRQIASSADPIEIERLGVDTGTATIEEALQGLLTDLRALGWPIPTADRG